MDWADRAITREGLDEFGSILGGSWTPHVHYQQPAGTEADGHRDQYIVIGDDAPVEMQASAVEWWSDEGHAVRVSTIDPVYQVAAAEGYDREEALSTGLSDALSRLEQEFDYEDVAETEHEVNRL